MRVVTQQMKQSLEPGEFLDSSHGFFNPQVIGQYFARTQQNESLPALRVLMHDMLLKTPTHTGTIVTNAGHNQVNWEIVPSELKMVFQRQMGDALQVFENIGIKRNNCWQVDVSPIYLFGGNPPKVLQEMQTKVEQAQAAMLKLYTGDAYVGDHWRSNLNTTFIQSGRLIHGFEKTWGNALGTRSKTTCSSTN